MVVAAPVAGDILPAGRPTTIRHIILTLRNIRVRRTERGFEPPPLVGRAATRYMLNTCSQDYVTYWIHRSFHSGFLYKHFHCLHHRYFQPTPWSVTAIHPVEITVVQLAMVAPIFVYPVHWCEYCYRGRWARDGEPLAPSLTPCWPRGFSFSPPFSFRFAFCLHTRGFPQSRFTRWPCTCTITASYNTRESLSSPDGGSLGNPTACSTTTTISTVTSTTGSTVTCGTRWAKTRGRPSECASLWESDFGVRTLETFFSWHIWRSMCVCARALHRSFYEKCSIFNIFTDYRIHLPTPVTQGQIIRRLLWGTEFNIFPKSILLRKKK